MTIALVTTIVLLICVCLVQWLMLGLAVDDLNDCEDFILSLAEQTKGGVMTNEAYCALVNEANDIRDAREPGDE